MSIFEETSFLEIQYDACEEYSNSVQTGSKGAQEAA